MLSDQLKPNYIVMAGMPRSGSTLLQLVLSNNELIFTLPETHFFEILDKKSLPLLLNNQQVNCLLNELKNESQLIFDDQKILQGLRTGKNIDAEMLYFNLIDLYRPSHDAIKKELIGLEKTPGHLAVIDDLLANNSDIKAILTKRNARDFTNSIIQTHWSPDKLSKVIDLWNDSIKKVMDLSKKYPDQLRVVSYERLITDAELVVSELCDFLKIEWSHSMLENINKNTVEVVVEFEYEWKKENLVRPQITADKSSIVLSWRQRIIVFFGTLMTSFRTRQLLYHRL